MQSSMMCNNLCGVRVNMMERRTLVAIGWKVINQIHDYNAMCIYYLPFYCMEVFEPVLVHQNKTLDESLNYCRQNYIDLVSPSSQINMEEVIRF